jgi:hypothetical protein
MPKEGKEQDQAQVLRQLNAQVIVPSPQSRLSFVLLLTQSDQIKRLVPLVERAGGTLSDSVTALSQVAILISDLSRLSLQLDFCEDYGSLTIYKPILLFPSFRLLNSQVSEESSLVWETSEMYERLLDYVGDFRLCGRFQIVWEISAMGAPGIAYKEPLGITLSKSPLGLRLQRAPWDYAYKEPLGITLTKSPWDP